MCKFARLLLCAVLGLINIRCSDVQDTYPTFVTDSSVLSFDETARELNFSFWLDLGDFPELADEQVSYEIWVCTAFRNGASTCTEGSKLPVDYLPITQITPHTGVLTSRRAVNVSVSVDPSKVPDGWLPLGALHLYVHSKDVVMTYANVDLEIR